MNTRKQGRPPGSTTSSPRNVIKQTRWTAEEWEEVTRLAEEAWMTESAFVRGRVLGEK